MSTNLLLEIGDCYNCHIVLNFLTFFFTITLGRPLPDFDWFTHLSLLILMETQEADSHVSQLINQITNKQNPERDKIRPRIETNVSL